MHNSGITGRPDEKEVLWKIPAVAVRQEMSRMEVVYVCLILFTFMCKFAHKCGNEPFE